MTPDTLSRIIRAFRWLVALAAIGVAGLWAMGRYREHPEDFPWTQLDLKQPIGMFTGRKLARLVEDPALCHRLLGEAKFRVAAPRDGGAGCSYSNAVSLLDGGGRGVALRPAEAVMSCSVAAAFIIWEREVVQPAAARHFGQRVVRIDHLGSYSCRRINGRETSDWSEHATANAIDVAAFTLKDGRRIAVVSGWQGAGADAAFLREVRDGSCRVFATTLSPDYNFAHRDHFHLDQARRGAVGGGYCR